MGDKTLGERVMYLEGAIGRLTVRLEELVSGVVLVEKRKPGPALKTVRKTRKYKSKSFKGPQPRRGWVPPEIKLD
ncbi:MAG: hypothetical protein ABH851_04100 [Methanobacteriota archaeon]